MGYEVVSKLATLHDSGLLDRQHIREVFDATQDSRVYAELFVNKYGNYLVGRYPQYTARWTLSEALIRLDEGDLEE